jgi:TonB family protein
MGIRRSLSAAALLLLSFSAAASAHEPIVLMPSSPWNVEHAPDSCVLARAFGPAAATVYLRLEQFEPGAQVEVSLVGSPLRSRKLVEHIQVAFGDGLRPITSTALFGESNEGKPALNFLLSLREAAGGDPANLAELTLAEVNALTELRFALLKDTRPLVLKTGKMNHAFPALKQCMDKLLTDWGINPDKLRSLSRRAEPLNPGRWLRPEDYPKGAIHAGRSASVHFRVTVEQDGRVSKCSIQNATEGRDFARRTCSVISRRARFQPALDANGRPVSSFYANTVRWIMSKAESRGVRLAEEMFDDLTR